MRFFALVALLLTALVTGGILHAGDDPSVAIANLLRAHPEDDQVFANAIAWAERHGGVGALAERFARDALAPSASASELHIAARLLAQAGKRAAALDFLERAVATTDALPASFVDLARLYLAGGWPERAAALWQKAPTRLPRHVRLEVGYRIAAATGDTEQAAQILESAAKDSNARTCAMWAEEMNQHDHAARMWTKHGDTERALAAWLAAGDWREALALRARTHLPITDAQALEIARLAGDAAILDEHLGARDDDAAAEARHQLARSLGTPGASAQAPSQGPVSESASGHEPGSTGTAGDVDSARPVDPTTFASTPRLAAAHKILGEEFRPGSEEYPRAVTALRASSDERPSLVIATALVSIGDDEAGRRELTRWFLDSNEDEREQWLARLRRERPAWFGAARGADLLAHIEEHDTHAALAPEWRALLARALVSATPGSAKEAMLLYHRGRILGDARDLERARALAPAQPVIVRAEGFALARSIADAVAVLRDEAPWPARIDSPDPVDAPLGADAEGVVRLRRDARLPLGAYRNDEGHLHSWRDDRDPVTDAARGAAAVGLAWDARSLTLSLPDGGRWHAGRIAPVTAAVRLPGAGWLVIGRGFAVLAAGAPHERVRLESENPMRLADLELLPIRFGTVLSPTLSSFVVQLQAPGPLPKWRALEDFLAGARRRQRDPSLEIVSFLRDGDAGAWIARTTSGERARFTREAPPAREMSIAGYERRADGVWWRAGAESTGTAHVSDTSFPRDALALRWTRQTDLPTRAAPRMAPVGPAPPPARSVPPELTNEAIVTTVWGPRCEVRITGAGHVLFYRANDLLPVWIGGIAPPLEGPEGFPTSPAPPRGSPGARGPHRAGPICDARSPGVFFSDRCIYVATDSIMSFDFDGHAESMPLARTPSEILAVTMTADGTVWTIPGDRSSLLLATREIELPRTGAFDAEGIGDRVWVLGWQDGRFWLASTSAADQTARLEEMPAIEMESDRAGLRFTALGRWGNTLLLLHETLVAREEDAGGAVSWRTLVTWDTDPMRFPYYLQEKPRLDGDTLVITRPWGVVEGWGPDKKANEEDER